MELGRGVADRRDQTGDYRVVGKSEDCGAGVRKRRGGGAWDRKRRWLAPGDRQRLFRQEAKYVRSVRRTFRGPGPETEGMVSEAMSETQSRALGYSYRISSVTALSGFLFGFDTAIIDRKS